MKDFIKFKIGSISWEIRFLPQHLMPEGTDGFTWTNRRVIDVRNDLDKVLTERIIIHELVHAILDTQGRCYQKKFDLEDVCEFIAWTNSDLNRYTNYILKERFGTEK